MIAILGTLAAMAVALPQTTPAPPSGSPETPSRSELSASGKIAAPDVDLILNQMPAGSGFHPIARLAIIVDGQGHVKDCKVVVSSGVPALDAAACKAGVAAANVKPDKDAAGAIVGPVKSLSVGFEAYAPVIFKKTAAYAALGEPGPFFPERELRTHVSGYAILECDSDAKGVLTRCVVTDQSPPTSAFGLAAEKMAETRWMTAAPGSGDHVLVRVDFNAPANFCLP